MDMFDGFVFLEEKKKSLIPILCQYDFLSALTAACFLCLLLGLVHIDPFQLVRTAVNLCDGLQDGIGVLRRHGVELTHALLSVEVLDGAQVWIQLIDNAMDFQIREPGIDLICRMS